MVTDTGVKTEFGKIAAELATVSQEKTPLEKRTEEIGKWLGIIAVSVCVLVVITSIVREAIRGKLDLQFILTMLMFAIALAVAAVPEALAAIVTGALAIGMREMAKRNALVRKMPAVETLGCTTVICSDKTGTLTKGEMTVRRVFGGGKSVEVSGVGYAPEGGLSPASNNPSLNMLFRGGILCNDSTLLEAGGKWSIKGDPTEGALVVLAAKAGLGKERNQRTITQDRGISFQLGQKENDHDSQMEDGKSRAFMKGAPEVILDRCSSLLKGDE